MIFQGKLSTLVLAVALMNGVYGASYSNMYLENDLPIRYYQYGTPYNYPSIVRSDLSQLNSLPASVPGYVTSCVSPCVVPGQSVATLDPSSTVLSYTQPQATVPIVVSPREDASAYEYSYVVYDKGTGDHKAQHELSDGAVVRGEYSFLQPDGYVQEVKYTADDVKGFNAVVKKFLPTEGEGTKKTITEKKESPPCPEIKNEAIKEKPIQKLDDKSVTSINDPKKENIQGNDQLTVIKKDSEKEPSSKDSKEPQKKIEVSTIGKEPKPIEQTEKQVPGKEPVKSEDIPKVDKIKSRKQSDDPGITSEVKYYKVMNNPTIPDEDALIPYQDVVRCVEAALRRATGKYDITKAELSPITYIVLNKPC